MMSNKVKKVAGKEGFQRINYLYQICNVLATQGRAGHIAALNYSNLAVNVSRKTVQRLDIDIKRTICKRCRCLMIPSITSRTRIKKKIVIHTCLKCQTSKTFDTRNEKYLPWTQRPESFVEMLDYSQDMCHNEQKKNENVGKNSEENNKNKTLNSKKIRENASKETKNDTQDHDQKHEVESVSHTTVIKTLKNSKKINENASRETKNDTQDHDKKPEESVSNTTVVSAVKINKLETHDIQIKDTKSSIDIVSTDAVASNLISNEPKEDNDSNLCEDKYLKNTVNSSSKISDDFKTPSNKHTEMEVDCSEELNTI